MKIIKIMMTMYVVVMMMGMMVLGMTINKDSDDSDDDAAVDDQELICNEPSVRPALSLHCTASTFFIQST